MPQSKAYVSLGKNGTVNAVCIIVDERQAGQAMKSLQRSHPGGAITEMSAARALKLMRKHEPDTASETH